MASVLKPIPANPAEWGLEDARKAIASAVQQLRTEPSTGLGDAWEYVQGRHWQNGVAWMGPGYAADGTLADTTKTRIGRHYAPVPECVQRVRTRVNGVCGNQADFSLKPAEPAAKDEDGNAVPSPAQVAAADEWRRDLSAYWDRVNLWGGIDVTRPTGVRGVVAYASAHLSGSACLRAFFNPASRTQDAADGSSRQIPRRPDRKTALRDIEVVAPEPDRCAVYIDPDTHQRTGVFLYTDASDNACAEIWYAEDQGGVTKTVMRILTDGSTSEPVYFPWKGKIPIAQADIGCLLTPPVLRLQASLDAAVTGGNRLAEAHGYTARTEINSEETGEWRTQPPPGIEVPKTKQLTNGTTAYFWPTDAALGNAVIRRLVGFEHTTGMEPDTGKETVGLTTPSVHYHEPSDPEAVVKWIDTLITLIRFNCHQGHIRSGLHGSTAEASGDAYEQARAEFEADVKSVAEVVDMMVAEHLECVTMMADWLAGQEAPSFSDDWIVAVQSHPSAGPVSTNRETSTLALVSGGIISSEEGTARVGIQDVQNERTRIDGNPWSQLKLLVERGNAAKALIDSGADRTAAWIAVGFDEQDAAKLARSDGPPFQGQ